MLFALLTLTLCDVTKLCLQTDATNKCPDGIGTESIFNASAELLKKLVKDGSYIIYTDATFELTQEQLIDTVEITSIKETISVTSKISSASDHAGITLNGITLDVTNVTSAKLLDGDAAPDPKITFMKATLDKSSSFKTASLVLIKKLQCTTIKSASDTLSFMVTTDAKITIIGNNLVEKVTGAGKGIKFTSGANDLDIPEGGPATTIMSTITKSSDFTLVSVCTQLEVSVDITLVFGNSGEAVITLKEDNFQKPPTPIVKVNTYYKKDASFEENGEATCVLNTDFLVDADGNRKVPITAKYCLDKANKRDATCPENATLLWGAKEILRTKNGNNLATIYLSGYNASGLSLDLKTLNDRHILFKGLEDKQQIITLTLEKKEESISGNLMFSSISLVATVPKDSTDKSLNFKNLLIINSKVSTVETTDPAPEAGKDPKPEVDAGSGSSRKLKDSTPADIKVNSEELTSDAASFKNFKAQKPSKSFSVANPKSLVFSGDGKTVTIDSVNFTDESIPVPFNIVALPGQDLKDVILKIDSDNGSPGKALPFAFDLKEGSNLSVKYSGDWSSNTIVVNVAAGSSFAGNKASDKDKSPVMEKQGSGTATLDDKVLVKSSDSSSGPKGLSGGAIAGIVIACVVAVAAIAVTAFIMIKKKAKVNN